MSNVDQIALGQRLKEVRKSCRLTQDQVAAHLGLVRTAVVNIEAGERWVSTLEISKLAQLFGRSIAELLIEDTIGEDALVVLHRLDEEFADDSEVRKEVSDHVAICRAGHSLKELLGMPEEDGPPDYHLSEPESTGDAVEQGNFVASQERKRLSLGNNPLPDLAKLIATQGVWAAKAKLPDGMSGMFLHEPTFGAAILINQGHRLSRRRFSFAHEYAHALLDRRASASVSTSKNRKDYREVRANAFAAAFLLPSEGVHSFLRHRRKTLPSRIDQVVYDPETELSHDFVEARTRIAASHSRVTYQDIASLMMFFRSSYQATCYRLRSLGLISKDELSELLEKEAVAKQAFAVLDLFDGDTASDENSNRFDEDVLRLQIVTLAVEAFRREEVSKGRLREISILLGIGAEDLLRLAEAA